MNADIHVKQLLLRGLMHIKLEGTWHVSIGICGQIQPECRSLLSELMVLWPEYSGEREYPVTVDRADPMILYHNTRNLWDEETEYGQARYRLLNWLIEQLQTEHIKV